jgi:hypothetical protein
MKLIGMRPKKISPRGVIEGVIFLLLLVAILLPLGLYLRSLDRAKEKDAVSLERHQEEFGYVATVVSRWDLDRKSWLQGERAAVIQQEKEFKDARNGRLQEALGLGIARSGLMILGQQNRLRKAVMAATDEARRFKEQQASRWQEKMGMAAVVAYRRAPQGTAFMEAFKREVSRLRKVETRKARRLETRRDALVAEEIRFQNTIPLLYEEAIASAKRSVRLREESVTARTGSLLYGLNNGLNWQREPEDYLHLAGLVRGVLIGPLGVSGFMEYGLPALIGLVMVMVWFDSMLIESRIIKNE